MTDGRSNMQPERTVPEAREAQRSARVISIGLGTGEPGWAGREQLSPVYTAWSGSGAGRRGASLGSLLSGCEKVISTGRGRNVKHAGLGRGGGRLRQTGATAGNTQSVERSLQINIKECMLSRKIFVSGTFIGKCKRTTTNILLVPLLNTGRDASRLFSAVDVNRAETEGVASAPPAENAFVLPDRSRVRDVASAVLDLLCR